MNARQRGGRTEQKEAAHAADNSANYKGRSRTGVPVKGHGLPGTFVQVLRFVFSPEGFIILLLPWPFLV